MQRLCRGVCLVLFLALPAVAISQDSPAESGSAEGTAFFEKHIRPVLVKECYSCHAATAEKIKGGLTLDTREGALQGGKTGPAVVPGDARNSLILTALRHTREELMMPPDKKLSDEVIANFETWIRMGAPDPRNGAAEYARDEIDIEKGRQFWSFQPPRATAPPAVKDAAWPRSDIDRFLLAAMEEKGLRPVADADPYTLLRRLHFDLAGLPPSPQETEQFAIEYAADPEGAVAAVVNKLLDSPQFGERWGRHWLDVARFAESSGRAANFAYPQAWRYRDYVIAAFNADKPYDQFIREQLAGDLLPADGDDQKAEFLVATGFLAIGPKSHDERSRQQFQMDLVDEQIDATFQVFQGLTVACARCHDHKFDPVPQQDYYALAGIFSSSETCYGTIRVIQSNHPSPLIELPESAHVTLALDPLSSTRRGGIERQIEQVDEQMAEQTGQDAFIRRLFLRSRKETLQSQLDQYDAEGNPRALAMGVRERRFAMDSRLYVRGELDQPGERVRRGFPQVLATKQPYIRRGSGRRELADFIASEENPLTARVMANRVWLHLMGRGLVPTPDNFGASGLPPSHPELLDHLALAFVEDGWSVKELIRRIVTSRAYQLSSQFDETNSEADPDNILVWRMPKQRLEAEALKDAMLALGGSLDLDPPRGSSVARGGEGRPNAGFPAGGFSGGGFRGRRGPFDRSGPADEPRTVYTAIVRDSLPEELTLFDFPDPSLIAGERSTTTVPAQSLYLMNNPFVIRQSERMADELFDHDRGQSEEADKARLTRAYLLCYSRPPSDSELNAALFFLDDYGRRHSVRSTWSALCQALLASAEFSQR